MLDRANGFGEGVPVLAFDFSWSSLIGLELVVFSAVISFSPEPEDGLVIVNPSL
jgi:hypothetical protein